MAARDAAAPGPHAAPAAHYRDMLRQGRFMLQRCTETGRPVFYPRVLSPHSGRPTLEWVEACGRGSVYSATTVRRKPEHGGDYNVALIDLEEGVRMMSRVVGLAPRDVTIGMAVRAEIVADGEDGMVVFRPLAIPA